MIEESVFVFRLSKVEDISRIWEILQEAIALRAAQGSQQWQDGYPNRNVVEQDIANAYGYVVEKDGLIIAYVAVIADGDPAYEAIDGAWMSNDPYLVIHRVAVTQSPYHKGVASIILREVEGVALASGIRSVRFDTNYDNAAMLHLAKKFDYVYCGKVLMRGGERLAFEKAVAI